MSCTLCNDIETFIDHACLFRITPLNNTLPSNEIEKSLKAAAELYMKQALLDIEETYDDFTTKITEFRASPSVPLSDEYPKVLLIFLREMA